MEAMEAMEARGAGDRRGVGVPERGVEEAKEGWGGEREVRKSWRRDGGEMEERWRRDGGEGGVRTR